MTDFLLWWHSPTTLVFLIGAAALAVVWRMSNATITLQWAAKTHEPERDQRAAKLKLERDEARRMAEEMRAR